MILFSKITQINYWGIAMDEIIGTQVLEDALKDKITLNEGEELEVSYRKKKKGSCPPFIAVGNGNTSKAFREKAVVDGFEIVCSLSPKQIEIFSYFKKQVLDNHLSAYRAKSYTPQINHVFFPKSTDPEADTIRKLLGQNNNATTMIDKNVIKKISLHEYMVNPYLLIPTKNFDEVAKLWDSLP